MPLLQLLLLVASVCVCVKVLFLLVSGALYRVMCVVHEEGKITRAGNVNGTYGLDDVESIF